LLHLDEDPNFEADNESDENASEGELPVHRGDPASSFSSSDEDESMEEGEEYK
jgi:hypothetical protein